MSKSGKVICKECKETFLKDRCILCMDLALYDTICDLCGKSTSSDKGCIYISDHACNSLFKLGRRIGKTKSTQNIIKVNYVKNNM